MNESGGYKQDAIRVGLLWLGLVVVLEAVWFATEILPRQYAEEAKIIDDAFNLLTILGIPVFSFVVAMLIYSAFRFRSRNDASEDGPPIKTSKPVVVTWLVVTSALALAILINPGFVGLAELRANPEADLVLEVEGQRWQWVVTYPNGAEVRDELVLPVDTRIRFDVTSVDVLHSFWVPGFRTKIDAVPGLVTSVYVTPTELGTFTDDVNLRLQCAELCGIGHARMVMPVRVVEKAEFESWMAEQLTAEAPAAEGRG